MKLIIILKSNEVIQIIPTTQVNRSELMRAISSVLNTDSNNLYFDDGFANHILIMKEMIKTIELIEEVKE